MVPSGPLLVITEPQTHWTQGRRGRWHSTCLHSGCEGGSKVHLPFDSVSPQNGARGMSHPEQPLSTVSSCPGASQLSACSLPAWRTACEPQQCFPFRYSLISPKRSGLCKYTKATTASSCQRVQQAKALIENTKVLFAFLCSSLFLGRGMKSDTTLFLTAPLNFLRLSMEGMASFKIILLISKAERLGREREKKKKKLPSACSHGCNVWDC